MLPSSSVVAPDTKTKALPAREPGSKHKPCRCDKSKCENMYCVCVNAGLPCCDRCECKDCDNTKTSEEKLQDLLENIRLREVPASGSRTCTMTARAAAKKSAMGCKCQGECASRCGCVRRNIKCTSKCKCKRCGNDDGSRFPKDVPGGQGGTHSSSSAVESLGKHVISPTVKHIQVPDLLLEASTARNFMICDVISLRTWP
ncbi:hypothetical protein D1007_45336 [Hordeum vulgare]|nr:hypothetical protein D1007_45336 [Hordeum vulgare]